MLAEAGREATSDAPHWCALTCPWVTQREAPRLTTRSSVQVTHFLRHSPNDTAHCLGTSSVAPSHMISIICIVRIYERHHRLLFYVNRELRLTRSKSRLLLLSLIQDHLVHYSSCPAFHPLLPFLALLPSRSLSHQDTEPSRREHHCLHSPLSMPPQCLSDELKACMPHGLYLVSFPFLYCTEGMPHNSDKLNE